MKDLPWVVQHTTTGLLQFYIPTTPGYRFSGTYRLFPQHCRMPTILEEDKTVEAAAPCLLEIIKKGIHKATKSKKQWLSIIKKLQAAISHGEPRVAMQGPPRVATPGHTRVDGAATTSSSPTCLQMLRVQPRIHQSKTRCNTPVMEHMTTELAWHGEGLRQTQKITCAMIRPSQETARGSPKLLTRGALGPNLFQLARRQNRGGPQ